MVVIQGERTPRDDTRLRIVDAAIALLRDGGRDAVTTRAVADRAGVQAPAIYRLFADKDGLLDAAAEGVLAGFVSAKTELADGEPEDADPVQALRAAWDRQIAFGVANPAVFWLVVDPGRTSAAAEAGMRVLAERIRRIDAAGRLRVTAERATRLVHAAGIGVTLALLSSAPERADGALADTMFATVAARILVPDDPAGAGDDPDAVIAAARRIGTLSPSELGLLDEWMHRRGTLPA